MRETTNSLSNTPRWIVAIFLVPGVLMPVTQDSLAASSTDSSVQISADRIKLEAANRRVLYSGKVRLKHETLTITGSRAVAQSKNTSSGKVTVTGKPVAAHFIDARGNMVRLKSHSLVYDATEKSLVAAGNVELQSIQGTLSGQVMRYDMASNQFSITGNRDAPRISAILNIHNSSVK